MRTALLLLVLLLAASAAEAQEFLLKLTYTVDGTPWSKPLYLGFDPSGSDTFDYPAKWKSNPKMPEYPEGELEVPSNDFGDIDCRLSGRVINRVALGTGCYIDIRQKPSSGGFDLQYEADIIANTATTAKLSWDQASIPSIIKHLYLASGEKPDKYRLDMTTTGEFNIPMDSFKLGKYHQMVLTLLYNQDTLGVAPALQSSGMMVYPSVLQSGEPLRVTLASAAKLQVRVFDEIGRLMRSADIEVYPGINDLPASLTALPTGTYHVELRDLSGSGLVSRQKLLVQ